MIDASHTLADSSGPDEGPQTSAYYHVDPSWFEENNLSFEDVVRARMCDTCRSRIGQDVEERVPVFDKATGRMRFEVQQSTYGSDPLKCIREHCGRAKSYIHRDMPTLEAIFRIFLANGNTPMTLDQVREQLAEWCPGGGCQWLLLPSEMVERLVQHDTHYGLRQTEGPARQS
ncbi:MAG: hypothetical protein JO352_13825 [Chloroflexi bacterium]|nr:hypothetical protein [Chloroflexota bacterium]